MAPAPRQRVVVDGSPDPRDIAGDFGHRVSIVVRFADTDAMGHVNNAAYLTYVELARIEWWMATTGEALIREPGRDQGLILAEAEVAFRSPVFFGETVVVETRASRIGRTSMGLEHRLTASLCRRRRSASSRRAGASSSGTTTWPRPRVPWPVELSDPGRGVRGSLGRS